MRTISNHTCWLKHLFVLRHLFEPAPFILNSDLPHRRCPQKPAPFISMSTNHPQPKPISFFSKLEARVEQVNSLLCIGLDPHLKELFPTDDNPADTRTEEQKCDAAFTFCKTLIDSTAPFAAAFKPNAAFFEALGPTLGMITLRRVIDAIPSSIPVLLDVKRGDIGTTAQAYAEACYEREPTRGLAADGVTLSPLMGYDSIQPFISGKYADRGAFLLCKTSNPGSNDLLTLDIADNDGSTPPLYEKIAAMTVQWSDRAWREAESNSTTAEEGEQTSVVQTKTPCLGLVVGATDTQALARTRSLVGDDIWILAPGIGAQGGDLEAACRAGFNSKGTGLLIPVSRAMSQATHPGMAAKSMQEAINSVRTSVLSTHACEAVESTTPVDSTNRSSYQRDFIDFCLNEGVLKFGSFVLKSGRTSPYFFNAGLFSSGRSLFQLGQAYATAIMSSSEMIDPSSHRIKFDVIFGPAYKGIPLGAVVSSALYRDYKVDVEFSYNRKEAKDHGEGGVLVGASMNGKRILIIDDVITAGTAIRESYNLLQSIGAIPIGVTVALDRAEKVSLDDPISAVQGVVRDFNIPVIPIITLPQIQSYLERNSAKYDSDSLHQVKVYRELYGVM